MAPKPKPGKKEGGKSVKIEEPPKVYKPDPSVLKRLKHLNQMKSDLKLDLFCVEIGSEQ